VVSDNSNTSLNPYETRIVIYARRTPRTAICKQQWRVTKLVIANNSKDTQIDVLVDPQFSIFSSFETRVESLANFN